MDRKEALCTLVRQHQKEFNAYVDLRKQFTSRRAAKAEAVKMLAIKYNKRYLGLRGKRDKGGV